MLNKHLILITNDDGTAVPGLRYLIKIMQGIGSDNDIVVVVPEKPQSGMGHAITIRTPLRVKTIRKNSNYAEYHCSGTPVDCIKFAINQILLRKPDLIVSGINHGSNSSVNIIYSGTMAAAIEGAILNIPSIGFSLIDYSFDVNIDKYKKHIKIITNNVLKHGLPPHTCLNVNIPVNKGDKIKGIKVCRQAQGYWEEEFEKRVDPHKKEYYWLTGSYKYCDEGEDTDEWALNNNYISIVPIHTDFSNHQAIPIINKWNFNV